MADNIFKTWDGVEIKPLDIIWVLYNDIPKPFVVRVNKKELHITNGKVMVVPLSNDMTCSEHSLTDPVAAFSSYIIALRFLANEKMKAVQRVLEQIKEETGEEPSIDPDKTTPF